jgi:nucleoside-diphosphate-sugar epimerase
MLRGESPTIYGDGLQSRDFTHVANVVRANLLACERNEAIGAVMNVACGERYTLLDLHNELKRAIGTSLPPTFAAERAGDVKHSMAAIEVAREKLGYAPIVKWQDGIRRTVEWYRQTMMAAVHA